jgi:hypothetical protein
MKNIRFKVSNFIILLFVVVISVDLFYTIKQNSTENQLKIKNELIDYFNKSTLNLKTDVINLNQPLLNTYSNILVTLDLLVKLDDKPIKNNNQAIFKTDTYISNTTNITNISNYKFGSAFGCPHCTIDGYLYKLNDIYCGEEILYIDRWGFATDRKIYKAIFEKSKNNSKSNEENQKSIVIKERIEKDDNRDST